MRKEMTTREVADVARCTPAAVRWAIRSWKLPARVVARPGGSRLLVSALDAKVFARKFALQRKRPSP